MILVFFKDKMCGGTQNGIKRRQFVGNEIRNLFEGFALKGYQKIETARDKVNAVNFGIFVNTLRNCIKALTSLRSYTYFD